MHACLWNRCKQFLTAKNRSWCPQRGQQMLRKWSRKLGSESMNKWKSQERISRTPDLRIFLAEKMWMGVFGQERGEISAFLYGKKCGENADGSIRTGTRRNLCILIWKKMRRKCRQCGLEYSNRNTEKSPHYIRISAITQRERREYFRIPNSPHPSHNAENNMENNAETDGRLRRIWSQLPWSKLHRILASSFLSSSYRVIFCLLHIG